MPTENPFKRLAQINFFFIDQHAHQHPQYIYAHTCIIVPNIQRLTKEPNHHEVENVYFDQTERLGTIPHAQGSDIFHSNLRLVSR